MAIKLERILNEKRADFAEWSQTRYSFLDMCLYSGHLTEDDQAMIWIDTELMYEDIFETLTEIGNFRDKWTLEAGLPLAVDRGLAVHYRTEKSETRFSFGTDDIGFFLNTDYLDFSKLRKMNDEFWYLFSELFRLGQPDFFQGTLVPSSENRKNPLLHRKSKSIMYTLIQQSLALEEYYGTAEDMGFITVYWDYNIAWEELLEKASSALSNLYKMDYQLWKRK